MEKECLEILVERFRDGGLVFSDARPEGVLTDDEIIQADKEGKLIGAQGVATMFASCGQCGWSSHNHFIIGDDERDDAQWFLQESHNKSGQCKSEVEYRETCK